MKVTVLEAHIPLPRRSRILSRHLSLKKREERERQEEEDGEDERRRKKKVKKVHTTNQIKPYLPPAKEARIPCTGGAIGTTF